MIRTRWDGERKAIAGEGGWPLHLKRFGALIADETGWRRLPDGLTFVLLLARQMTGHPECECHDRQRRVETPR